MHKEKAVRGLAASLLLVAGVAAANAQNRPATETPVTLIQAHNNFVVGEEVFIYAVPEKLGFFKEENLKVNIVNSPGGSVAAQALQAGSAQFATTQPEIIIKTREQGGKILGYYNLKTRGSYAIGVPEDSSIKTLADIKGKTLGVSSLSSGAIPIIVESLVDAGVTKTDFTMVAAGVGAQAATAVRTKRVDALGLWDSAYGAMENLGVKMNYIDLPLIGKLASFVLATSDKFMADNPQAVEGFCRAIAKGWVFTLENPEAAIRIFHEVFPQTKNTSLSDNDAVAQDVHVLKKWLASGAAGQRPGFGYGYNYPDQWEFTSDYFKKQGMFEGKQPAKESFTNKFIDGCNKFDVKAIKAAAQNYKKG